jgi:capsular polysaccharide biosynthesis protein
MPTLHSLKRHLRPLLPLIGIGRAIAVRLNEATGGGVAGIVEDARTGGVPGLEWRELIPAERVQRKPPIPVAGPLPWQYFHNLSGKRRAEGIFRIREARFRARYGGDLLTEDRRLVLEVSRDIWPTAAHGARLHTWRDGVRLAGLTAVLTTPEARGNFWHWMTELLPRIHLIERSGIRIQDVDTFLVNDTLSSYRLASLRALGVPLDRIRVVGSGETFTLEEALVPTLREQHWDLPAWAASWLGERLPTGEWSGGRRLYLTRRNCAFRRLTNEDALLPLLEAAGFEQFEPERYPLEVQCAAFRSAEAIIGVHGSAWTLSMLCQKGIPFIELMPSNYVDLCFWTCADFARTRHHLLMGDGEQPQEGESPRARFSDLSVSETHFREALLTAGL